MMRWPGDILMKELGLLDVLKASEVPRQAQGVAVVGSGWCPAVC